MKKYFFGYLFVRIAKFLALTIVVIGIAYVLFQFAQAAVAAESARYQRSVSLKQRLEKLTARLSETRRLVSNFTSPRKIKSEVNLPRLSANIESTGDFERLAEALQAIDRERQGLKESLVERFESLIAEIQNKLRAHAASLSPPATTSVTSPAAPTPVPTQTTPAHYEPETLFSEDSMAQIKDRSSRLGESKKELKDLETKAENPESRSKLSESIDQLDAFQRLLPSKTDVTVESQLVVTQGPQSPLTEPRKVLNAEKVANQLAQLRSSVREAVLTNWGVDEAFDHASELAFEEQNKCRSATLTVKGIWLSTFGQMGKIAVATVFVAFLILVMADLTQTLLDTATNTGVIAKSSPPK